MRIIARLNVGGPAQHAVLLDEGLRDLGWQTLLVHGSVSRGEESLEEMVVARKIPMVKVAELGRRVHAWQDLAAARQIARAIRRFRPDVIHTHTAKAGTLGRLLGIAYNATHGRRQRILLVHTFHGNVLSGYFGPIGSFAVRAVERTLAMGTHTIIAISPRQRDELVRRFRVAPGTKVRLIPLGLELTALFHAREGRSCRDELRLTPQNFVIGYVGRFVTIKDLPTLLRAFAQVLKSVPEARLVLVGDGDVRASLGRQAFELGVAEYIRFAGWRRDLPALYATFDVVALSSLNEGTPVMLIEAMAAGLPTVATAVGGVPDIVADDETGLLVPAGNPPLLAAALIRLAGDPDERVRLGRKGHKTVRERFEIGRLVADVDSLYREGITQLRANQ